MTRFVAELPKAVSLSEGDRTRGWALGSVAIACLAKNRRRLNLLALAALESKSTMPRKMRRNLACDKRESVDARDVGPSALGKPIRRFVLESTFKGAKSSERCSGESNGIFATTPDADAKFAKAAFRDGALRNTGTAITKVLPPVSRFSKEKGHREKKQRVVQLLGEFFERSLG